MSGLAHLRTLAEGKRPSDDGLLGNTRCAWGARELLSEEAILAAFAARPFNLEGEHLGVETKLSAALIAQDCALVADLYGGRIGRLWCVGSGLTPTPEEHVDVPFDPDLRQERGNFYFRADDHPDLAEAAVDPLLAAVRSLVRQEQADGKLRVRAYTARAFGTADAHAALVGLFTLGNETVRTAGFRYAVVGANSFSTHAISEAAIAREWTPRF